MSYIDPDLPLIDLHRHLDGSIRLQTILELGKQHHLMLPANTTEGLRPFVQVTEPQPGVMEFIAKFHWMTYVLVDFAACRRIAYENVEDAVREGLDYIELRFSPYFMAEAHQLDPYGVVEAVCDGVEDGARKFGLPVKLIGILSRTYGPEIAMQELNALLSQKERIVALDLAGDEVNYPAGLFMKHFQIAREAGWHLTAHAGESDGAHSIWAAINELGAERIGHAISALNDEKLISVLREKKIGIECNLTSNVQTSTVSDFRHHPLRHFLAYGLLATINTDDPGISGINLRHEYEVAAPLAGLDCDQTHQLQKNAFETAFLTAEEKAGIISRKENAK